MKTWLKIVITAVVGFLAAWLCYQVFNLDQVVTTVVAIIVALAVLNRLQKIKNSDA